MKKLKTIGAWALVAIIVASVGLVIYNPTIPISFTEVKAQSLVAEKIPMTINKDGVIYDISDATLDFLPSGSIRVTGDLGADRKGSTATGTFDAEGLLAYNNGAFYLKNLVVHEVKVDEINLNEQDQTLADSGKELLGALQKKFLKDKPATNILVEQAKAKIVKGAKTYAIAQLATVPIYKLDPTDVKHNFARMALNDISVTDDAMTVTLSIGHLVSTVWLYILAGLAAIGLAFAMVRSGADGALFAIFLWS